MSIKILLSVARESLDTSSDNELAQFVRTAALAEDTISNAMDTIIGLYRNGPLRDGDVPSKQERDWLLMNDLAAKVVVKGEDGYQALTYNGARVFWLMEAILIDRQK